MAFAAERIAGGVVAKSTDYFVKRVTKGKMAECLKRLKTTKKFKMNFLGEET